MNGVERDTSSDLPAPLVRARRRIGAPNRSISVVVALAAIAASAVWAFLPLPEPAFPAVDPVLAKPSPVQKNTTLAALDTAAFQAPLWIAPPAPPPPTTIAAPAPPPPPMRLQLLAIVQDEKGGGFRAVIYDPDSDKVMVAAEGEQLAGRTFQRIEAARVELLDHGNVRRLTLRDKDGAPSGGGG